MENLHCRKEYRSTFACACFSVSVCLAGSTDGLPVSFAYRDREQSECLSSQVLGTTYVSGRSGADQDHRQYRLTHTVTNSRYASLGWEWA